MAERAMPGDAADFREIEARLRDQEVLASLGRMTAIVVHEVRNPLAGISGVLQILRSRLPEEHADRMLFDQMLTRIGDLSDLTNDLLDYSRPRRLQRVDSSLREVAVQAAWLVQQDPAFARISVSIEGPDVWAPLDPQQFVAVLQNLIINAAQAMGAAGVVDVTTEAGEESCRILVTDHGPGIPPDVLSHLFEPFFTTKARGTGLGLALSHQVVEAHDGTIQAMNSRRGGAVFRIELPTLRRRVALAG